MLAYHGDPAIKEKYIARVRAHRLADHLIQGTGWSHTVQRGCAVGCTLESYDHARYPIELGIPTHVAYLEDALFELLPQELAMTWPERFLSAIRPGTDLSRVWSEWAIWALVDKQHGMIRTYELVDEQYGMVRTYGFARAQLVDAAHLVADRLRSGVPGGVLDSPNELGAIGIMVWRAGVGTDGWLGIAREAAGVVILIADEKESSGQRNELTGEWTGEEIANRWICAACDKLIDLLASAPLPV
jgi:hypothetical protein